VSKSLQVIETIDLAILVLSENCFGTFEKELLDAFYEQGVPCLFVHNKTDRFALKPELMHLLKDKFNSPVVEFSTLHPDNLEELVDAIRRVMPATAYRRQSLLGDFLHTVIGCLPCR
jgi:predicted GTPase